MLWHKIQGSGGIRAGAEVYDWEFVNPVIDSETSFDTDTRFPFGVHISYDGNWLFLGDYNAGDVLTYSLSTPFDVSTASSLVRRTSFDNTNSPLGFHFNSDGLTFYFADSSANTVKQYSLSSAWDLSTVSLSTSISGLSSLQKVFIDETGGHMYTSGGSSASIQHYTLSTAFDVSSASYADTGPSTNGSGVAVNQNGTKLFASNNATDDLLIYELSTPYDASTATLSSSIDLSSTTGSLNSGDISRDGVWAYGGSNAGDKIIQVKMQP